MVANRVAAAPQKPGAKKATDNWRQIQFGSVLINSPALDAKAGRQGRAESQRALQALGQALGRPGVTLKETRGVPYYSADPQHPGVIILHFLLHCQGCQWQVQGKRRLIWRVHSNA